MSRFYNDVKHEYRLSRVALSLRRTLKTVEAKPFNFGSLLISQEDFDDQDGDTIDGTSGGIPKDILMLLLQTAIDAVNERLAKSEIVLPATGDDGV